MKRDIGLGPEFTEPRWRPLVCLVLVAFLLYNPFFTILGSSRDVSVQHPLSYRATVAGTELQRCTLETGSPLLPELDAAILYAVSLFSPPRELTLVQPRDSAGPMSQASCDSIWFRPPPSA